MNELTKKYRMKKNEADFEIFAKRRGRLYGMIINTDPKDDFETCWNAATLVNEHNRHFDLEIASDEVEAKLTDDDSIEEISDAPQHDLKVDDLVWVWNDTKIYKKIRCFAGWQDGQILAWNNGETSECNTATFTWKYWEKYQPEQAQEAQEQPEEKPDFETQQEIWQWLIEGNKVVCLVGDKDIVYFVDGALNHSYEFDMPHNWKKYIEPKKTEWFDLLDGTEDNAMVCWLTCMPHTLFIAFKTEIRRGVACIYNDNQSCVYKNQIQPIMPLAEFKKLYPSPID